MQQDISYCCINLQWARHINMSCPVVSEVSLAMFHLSSFCTMSIVGFLINQSHGREQTPSGEKIKTHTCELMLTVNAAGVFDVDEIFLWLRNKNAWIKANKNNGAGNDTFIIHDGASAIHLFFHLLIYYFYLSSDLVL